MPSAFPGSLDDLSNPAGGDQVAVVLHSSQHGNVNDIIEAIERKLGIGDSVPGSTPGVLRRTGNGVSQWGLIQGSDLDPAQTGSAWAMLLDYKETTDLWNPGGVTGTGTAIGTAKSFTVQSSTSLVEIAVRLSIFNSTAPSNALETALYILIDGTTRYNLGGTGNNGYSNPLAGGAPVYISGLSAGSHTVQAFLISTSASSGWYLRPATYPNNEFFYIQVIEHKAGVGVKGEVGPSAQTAGGTKLQLVDDQTVDATITLPSGSWVTVRGPLTFTVDDPASIIEINLAAFLLIGPGAASPYSRFLIDGSITRPAGGEWFPSGDYTNPLHGSAAFVTELAAGSHTVAIQVQSGAAATQTYYCRPSGGEWLRVTVLEHKQGGLAWVYKSTWSAATTYAKNDVVIRNGSAYVALQPHTGQDPVTATAYWGLMASKGDIGIAWKGPWSAAIAYVPNDTVSQNGSTWIAKANNTNQDPPSSPASWDLLAAAGSMINPMTTADDLIVGGTLGTPVRMAKGANGRVFGVDASGVLGYRQLVAGDLPAGLITSAMIQDGTIVNADINTSAGIAWTKTAATGFPNTVLGTQDGTNCAAYYIESLIRSGVLTGTMIAPNNINTAHLQDGSVTSAKIQDGGVGTFDIAPRSITSALTTSAAPSGGLPAGSWVYTALNLSISGLLTNQSYVLVTFTFTMQVGTVGALIGIGIGLDSSTGPTTYMHGQNYLANGLVTQFLTFVHTATATSHTYYGLSYVNSGTASMVGYPERIEAIVFHR